MTAAQMRRIRAKPAEARRLTADAEKLAVDGYGDRTLRYITERAATDTETANEALAAWEWRNAEIAAQVARQVEQDASLGGAQ